MSAVDDPSRGPQIREIISKKPGLHALYLEFYERYRAALNNTKVPGLAIEIGAGAGFVREAIPGVIASDILPYDNLDVVFDARAMPFPDESVRFLCMLNVFHHIPDVMGFLQEAQRCLKPGGRILILDQHRGWLSRWILQYAHSEPYVPDSPVWSFQTTGPLSGANGALAWIVFRRDLAHFRAKFPSLELEEYSPHTPLRYWLTGGLKSWSLLPGALFNIATRIDALLLAISPQFGSFVSITVKKATKSRKSQ